MIALVGCAHRELMPVLGRWNGQLEVVLGEKDSGMKGYLMLYATHKKFLLHFEGPQEAMDLSGNWTLKGKQVLMDVVDQKFDDQGGEEKRDPNKPFIPVADLRQAFGKSMVLNRGKDDQTLTGPPVSLGKLQVRQSFTRQ